MSSSKQNSVVGKEKLVTVTTDVLKERLNKLYDRLHGHTNAKVLSQTGLFNYLWDLKEVALLEGKSSVELPRHWLEDVDFELSNERMRAH